MNTDAKLAIAELRKMKFNSQPRTAAQEIILNEWYQARDSHNDERMERAEIAANEIAHMNERIKERLPK